MNSTTKTRLSSLIELATSINQQTAWDRSSSRPSLFPRNAAVDAATALSLLGLRRSKT